MSQPATTSAESIRLDHVWNQLNLELQGRALQLLVRLALHSVRPSDPSLTPLTAEGSHATANGECQDPA